jgi:hypothetical protein
MGPLTSGAVLGKLAIMRTHILALIPIALLAATPLSAAETTVWRIGTFDHASAEFRGREAETPPVIDADAPDAAAH